MSGAGTSMAAGQQQSYQGQGIQVQRPASAELLDTYGRYLERLRTVASRLEEFTNRVVGPRPQTLSDPKSSNQVPSVPNNLHAQFSALNTAMSMALDDCMRSIEALESFV